MLHSRESPARNVFTSYELLCHTFQTGIAKLLPSADVASGQLVKGSIMEETFRPGFEPIVAGHRHQKRGTFCNNSL